MKEKGLWISENLIKSCGLSGNELLIYAYIYNFSQDGKSMYYGTIKTLAELFNITDRAVINILQKLVENKKIYKYIKTGNNVCYATYEDTEKSSYSEKSSQYEKSSLDTEKSSQPSKRKEIINLKQSNNNIIPATQNEMIEFCSLNKINIDLQAFIDYYEERNWCRYDKNLKKYIPVKNWKGAIRNWARNDKRYNEERKVSIESKKAYIKDVEYKTKQKETAQQRDDRNLKRLEEIGEEMLKEWNNDNRGNK